MLKNNTLKSIGFILVLFLLANGCKNEKKNEMIPFESFSVARTNISHFSEVGSIKKAVKLETTEDSLIGTVEKVVCGKNGDLYIGDYDSAKKILRFDSEGNYIQSYGKTGEGPGEYSYLRAFDLTGEGNIVLVSFHKLIMYNKEGRLIKQIRLNYFANDIKIVGQNIYLYITRYRYSEKKKKAIFVLNTGLQKIGEFGTHDSRVEKYSFLTRTSIVNVDSLLYFINLYDLKINQYYPGKNLVREIHVPNQNNRLDKTWNKKKLREEDCREIKNRLHRFNSIRAYGKDIILLEICKEKNLYDLWRLNPNTKKIIIYPYFKIFRDPRLESQQNLSPGWIAGSSKNQLITVLENVEDFNKYKKNFEILKDIEYKMEDNPILVFFEFHK